MIPAETPPVDELRARLRRLTVKWVSIGRHPSRAGSEEGKLEKAVYERCAAEVLAELHKEMP